MNGGFLFSFIFRWKYISVENKIDRNICTSFYWESFESIFRNGILESLLLRPRKINSFRVMFQLCKNIISLYINDALLVPNENNRLVVLK